MRVGAPLVGWGAAVISAEIPVAVVDCSLGLLIAA
jgi:hypothetical protein